MSKTLFTIVIDGTKVKTRKRLAPPTRVMRDRTKYFRNAKHKEARDE